MRDLELPVLATSAHFRFTTELEGVSYGFEFRWNHRAEQWKMSVFDGDGMALVQGIGVVLGFGLLSGYRGYGSLPPGDIIAHDTEGKNTDPGFADLGRRVILVYRTST